MTAPEKSEPRSLAVRLAVALFLLAAVLWGAWVRIDTTLRDPDFDAEDARGILRSDPALLHYLCQRIVAAGGGVPADFQADPRLQHPFVTDVPAEFPVGQEFLVAWAARALFPDLPLHVVALRVMSCLAASFVLGIYWCVRATTGRASLGVLAVLLALVTPANYRTIGFLMVGEDLALPLFVLHLGLACVAHRARSVPGFLASGVALAAALATWHALSFVLLLELALVYLWTLARARSPFAERATWFVLVAPLAAAGLVPVLRASGFLFSPAAALACALAVAGLERVRRAGAGRTRLVLLGVAGAGLLLGRALAPSSYDHVHAVVRAKLEHLGRLPLDPRELSFDARLLWQGPFETLAPDAILSWCGWPLALLLGAALASLLWRRERDGLAWLVLGLALVAWPAAWMFGRLAALVGLFVPGAAVLALAGPRRRGPWLLAGALVFLLQARGFARYLGEHEIDWYLPAPARSELTALVEFVRAEVPPDEPILGDFVNSTALLAHTGNPIVLQPKYETDRSRRAAEAFLDTFFRGTPQDLARLMRARFRCRFLLVDARLLWEGSRYTAGLEPGLAAPPAGSAAEALLSDDAARLAALPDFELLYRGRPDLPWVDYRLFQLRP